jgi:hypothetical protein
LLYSESAGTFGTGQLSYVGEICVRHYATFAPPRKQIGAAYGATRLAGREYRWLFDDGVEVSREQSCRILQDALRNYARWVDQANGVEIWVPAALPECDWEILY